MSRHQSNIKATRWASRNQITCNLVSYCNKKNFRSKSYIKNYNNYVKIIKDMKKVFQHFMKLKIFTRNSETWTFLLHNRWLIKLGNELSVFFVFFCFFNKSGSSLYYTATYRPRAYTFPSTLSISRGWQDPVSSPYYLNARSRCNWVSHVSTQKLESSVVRSLAKAVHPVNRSKSDANIAAVDA